VNHRLLERLRASHESERGAALLLAIGFMLMVGAISAGLLAFITTSVGHRPQLDAIRDRQYAADGAVEYAIAEVRQLAEPGLDACPTTSQTINDVTIQVDCRNALTTVRLLEQRNVVFSACVEPSVPGPCAEDDVIVRAQVNFEKKTGAANPVTATYIQSWSVNE
jgi:hypothetical protein